MITVHSRILQAPTLGYGRSNKDQPQLGSWNLNKKVFYKPATLPKWACRFIALERDRGKVRIQDIDGVVNSAQNEFVNKYGMTSQNRAATEIVTIPSLAEDKYEEVEAVVQKMIKQADQQEIRLLWIVIPNVDTFLYSQIKFYGDYKFGVHTIVITNRLFSKNYQRLDFGLIANEALKFNAKCGGKNWKLASNDLAPIDRTTMVSTPLAC
jgi:eukaryotic translation initiation factor 2C